MLGPDLRNDCHALLAPRFGAAGLRRRSALAAALGVGCTAHVLPALAQAQVQTRADGLTVGEISYSVGGFQVPAYRAQPAGRSGLPVVLLIHEVFGVHEYIADTARRLARAGYLVIAPELFARQGDPMAYGELAKLMAEVVAMTPDAQVMADLDGALAWAAGNGGDTSRAAITGFCWGGRITWLYAAHGPVKAGVAWYGRLVGASSGFTPRHPIDVAGQLKAPVLGLYGGADVAIPLETVERMKAALAAGGASSRAARDSRFVVYPQAPHAFHADYRPTYRAEPAQDGWTRTLAWLQAHGVA